MGGVGILCSLGKGIPRLLCLPEKLTWFELAWCHIVRLGWKSIRFRRLAQPSLAPAPSPLRMRPLSRRGCPRAGGRLDFTRVDKGLPTSKRGGCLKVARVTRSLICEQAKACTSWIWLIPFSTGSDICAILLSLSGGQCWLPHSYGVWTPRGTP